LASFGALRQSRRFHASLAALLLVTALFVESLVGLNLCGPSAYCMLLRALCLNLGLAKLLFPSLSSLPPKCSIFRIDRLALKLAALFNLLFEKSFPIERHARPRQEEAASRETA